MLSKKQYVKKNRSKRQSRVHNKSLQKIKETNKDIKRELNEIKKKKQLLEIR